MVDTSIRKAVNNLVFLTIVLIISPQILRSADSLNYKEIHQVCNREIKNPSKEYDTVQPLQESSFEALPIISYDTDVGFGYGAKLFFLNFLSATESLDLVLFNSTKGERWYRLVFSIPDFETRQGKIYPFAFDLVIDYDKWIKNSFFGIGNTSMYDSREFYTKEPLEISLTASRGFTPNLVSQAGMRYKTVKNSNFEETSRLINLNPSINSSRAEYASVFLNIRYDTGNSFINPSEGIVVQGEAEFVPAISLNDVSFSKYSGSIQYYTGLFYPKTILALRFGIQSLAGDNLPVQVLLPIGGNNTLRGYPQDRFLDKNSAVFNAELRFPVYWRFGGLIALDAGKVWSSLDKFDLKRWAINPVAGLRFYMDTFLVRVDVGFGKESTGIYFNFGHIF